MEIKIENANNKLLDQLYIIEEQCFKDEAFSKRQIGYLLTDYNTIALVARVNADITGFLIAQIDLVENCESGHIITLNVHPNYRRKHIATKLLQAIEILLKQRSISECRLEVKEDNHVAVKLYKNRGYEVVEKLANYYGKKSGLYLRKKL